VQAKRDKLFSSSSKPIRAVSLGEPLQGSHHAALEKRNYVLALAEPCTSLLSEDSKVVACSPSKEISHLSNPGIRPSLFGTGDLGDAIVHALRAGRIPVRRSFRSSGVDDLIPDCATTSIHFKVQSRHPPVDGCWHTHEEL
jgi:hypothetical protein